MKNQLALISFMFVLQFFGYTITEAFLAYHTSSFLSVFEISMLILALYACFSLATLISGKIVEQYGTVTSIRLGAILYAPLPFILSVSTNFWHLFAGALLVGIGGALLWTAGKTFVLRNFDKRGQSYGLFHGSARLGGAAAGILGGWFSLNYILNDVFILGGVSILLAVLVSFFLTDEKESRHKYHLHEQWKLFRNKDLLYLGFVGLIGSLFLGMVTPLGALIVKSLGGQAFEVGMITGIAAFFAFLSMVLGGRISDKVGRKPVAYISLIAGAVASFLLYFAVDNWMVLIAVVMYGIFWWTCVTVLNSAIGDLFKTKLALANALFNFFLVSGISIGALLAGTLSFESLRFPFFVLGILLLLSPIVVRKVNIK